LLVGAVREPPGNVGTANIDNAASAVHNHRLPSRAIANRPYIAMMTMGINADIRRSNGATQRLVGA
jgi:hypothetical protein